MKCRSGVGPRLHPSCPKTETDELFGQTVRGQLPYPASLESSATDEHSSIQERSGGQNNRLRFKNCPGICLDTTDFEFSKRKEVTKSA